MGTIKDFKAWLDEVSLDGYEEVYSLYSSVKNVEKWMSYTTKVRPCKTGNQYFVEADGCDDTLLLASEEAKKAFLKFLEDTYCDEGMDMESWYGYNYMMQKDQ